MHKLLSVSLSPRLRVNCGGIVDILTFSTPSQPGLPQQQDLLALGQLLLSVALQSPTAADPKNYRHSLDTLAARYPPDLHHIIQ